MSVRRDRRDPGHVRSRPGLSLVELLAALLVAGVLVGLAVRHFRAYERKYIIATMVGDLRKLAALEGTYWHDLRIYTPTLAALGFVPSPHVTVTIVTADSTGWSARAAYEPDPARLTCAIYVGTAPPLRPATARNTIGCTE